MRRDAHDTDAGMAGEIEFLAPDSRAFGDSAQADFVGLDVDDANGFDGDEPPRSRWLTGVAAVVVCALIAAGVVAAAPWSDDAADAPTTTTTAPPPSTAVAPAPTINVLQGVDVTPSGWVVDDPPADLRFAGAWSQRTTSHVTSPLDIWTDRPDDPAQGRWVTVRANEYAMGGYVVPDGARFVAGGRDAVARAGENDVTTIRATMDRTGDPSAGDIEIRAHGIELDALVDLVGRLEIGTGALTYGDGQAPATAGMALVWTGNVPANAFGAFGDPESTVLLFEPDDGSGMQIERRPVDSTLAPLMPLLLTEVALPEGADQDMRALGRPTNVYAFGPNDDEPWLFATWVDGAESLTVTSFDLDRTTMLAAVASARPAALDEWVRLVEQTQRGITFDEGKPSPSASLEGTFADGTTWTGSFSPTYFSIRAAGEDGWYCPLRVPGGTEVRRYAGVDVDIVTATALWPEPARTMRVTAGGGPPVDVPMVQVGDGPIFVAMYAQREIGPIEVELIDD